MSQPLEFPKDVQVSEIVKDVLIKMLVPDDSSRISWPELFSH